MRLRALVSARVQEAAAIILQIISPRVHAILLKITRLRRRGRQLAAYRIHTSLFFSRARARTRVPMRGFRYTRTPMKDARGSRLNGEGCFARLLLLIDRHVEVVT